MSGLHPDYPICGIDISKWQVWNDPLKTKEMGVQFVLIRAGNGVVRDTRMNEHRHKAEKYDLPAAFYWYWQPGLPAVDQARACRRALGSGDVIYADLEKNKVDLWPVGATAGMITRLALEFLDAIDQQMSDESGIYTSPGWWGNWILRPAVGKFRLAQRPLWAAQWRYTFTKKPYPLPHGWPKFDLWQFSGNTGPWAQKARLFGITQSVSVDVNAFNGDEDKLRRLFKVRQKVSDHENQAV